MNLQSIRKTPTTHYGKGMRISRTKTEFPDLNGSQPFKNNGNQANSSHLFHPSTIPSTENVLETSSIYYSFRRNHLTARKSTLISLGDPLLLLHHHFVQSSFHHHQGLQEVLCHPYPEHSSKKYLGKMEDSWLSS